MSGSGRTEAHLQSCHFILRLRSPLLHLRQRFLPLLERLQGRLGLPVLQLHGHFLLVHNRRQRVSFLRQGGVGPLQMGDVGVGGG